MPTPTKAQFEAAAKKVMETAPPGLSRDQFFDLIDKEMGVYTPTPGSAEATTRAIAESSGGLQPPRKLTNESGEEVDEQGKPIPSNRLTNFYRNTVRNPALQGAAHPTGVGDMLPLLIPSTAGTGELSLPSLLRGWKRMAGAGVDAAGGGSVLSKPGRFIQGAWQEGKTPPPIAVDHYSPNISTAKRTASSPLPSEKVSYGAPEATPAMDIGRLTGGKAPTLEETLIEALTDASGGESPSLVSSHPSTLEVAGEGALKQSGKFGKSGSKGQAGGYSSGRPGISDTRYDEVLNKMGGKSQTAYHDITNPEWHSGETPGSPSARSAQTLHEAEGAMSSDFKRKMEDPLASLLLALLGGESAHSLMSSHETP